MLLRWVVFLTTLQVCTMYPISCMLILLGQVKNSVKNSWLSFVWVATYNYASLPMIIWELLTQVFIVGATVVPANQVKSVDQVLGMELDRILCMHANHEPPPPLPLLLRFLGQLFCCGSPSATNYNLMRGGKLIQCLCIHARNEWPL
jgi:hypothetical protein